MPGYSLSLLAAGPAMTDRSLAIVLAIGFVSLFTALAVLVWTQWGQARPIAKCAGLSFVAHVLLLVYAYSTRVLFDQPGHWTGQTVKVHLAIPRDDEEAALLPEGKEPQAWEQPGADDSEVLNILAPMRREAKPSNLQRTPVAIEPPSPETPQPAPLPNRVPPLAAVATTVPRRPAEATPPEAEPRQETTSSEPVEELLANQPPVDGLPDELMTPLANLPRRGALPKTSTNNAADNVATTDTASPSSANPLRNQSTAPENDVGPLPPPNAADSLAETFAAAPAVVPRRLGDGKPLAEALRARVVADRLKVAQQFGATPQTEAAVAAALNWLATAQSADGRWDADAHGAGRETRTLGHDRKGAGAQADTGVSGLALLAFLGSGQTHLEGEHRATVQHGLEFLLASQAADGNLAGNAELFASMYCHGIATLALSEAYALTGDERLLPGLQRALRYTIAAQHAGGGWRYQPHDAGDISQFGWQLMALRSAELAGLPIPADTRTKMARFLRSASSGKAKGLASYRPGDRVSRTMTAEALVCRYFLQAENAAATLDEAAALVIEEPPQAAGTNYYYWYYGTLAMFQRQGDDWHIWNTALQRQLLTTQRFDGTAAGTWDPDPQWGGYGGRVYSTATAALCLEVYYRYLPIYGGKTSREDRLTERPNWSGLPR